MKVENRIVLIALLLGVVVGILDGVVDFFFFYEDTLLNVLIFDVPPLELYIRSLIMAIFLVFGLVLRSIVRRLRLSAERYRENEERWNFALQGSGHGVWDWKIKENQVFLSGPCNEILGCPGEQSCDNLFVEWQKKVHADDRPELQERFAAHLSGESPCYEDEHRVKNRQGRYIWSYSQGKVISRDEEGNPLRMVGIHRDISERKRAEKEREDLLNKLSENLKKVEILSGLLPICASCKKIRKDDGYWTQIETFMKENAAIEFTHGICPDCAKKLYPDIEFEDDF